ncbi:YidB family protein [Microvirga sesbaniae]|uniref:YidB family protein n=1 Tax=Microvirga sesbaniae TaxID=681392 RepID=UPI0021C6C0AD|nr:YidB family protein [Microvirga sp. HBU67692]
MSRGFPSMTALLGLLAVAGFQNRDKIAEMLGGLGNNPAGAPGAPGGSAPQQGGLGGALGGALGGGLGGLGGLLGGLSGQNPGGLLSGGLGELVDSFRQNGQGDIADSWVGTGPNKEVAPHQLEQAIGPDTLATLTQQTGLSREEILARLSRELPRAVDQYTPEGRIPSA